MQFSSHNMIVMPTRYVYLFLQAFAIKCLVQGWHFPLGLNDFIFAKVTWNTKWSRHLKDACFETVIILFMIQYIKLIMMHWKRLTIFTNVSLSFKGGLKSKNLFFLLNIFYYPGVFSCIKHQTFNKYDKLFMWKNVLM